MANISSELSAILSAVYGEDVRESIHNAIDKINAVNEDAAKDMTLAIADLVKTQNRVNAGLYKTLKIGRAIVSTPRVKVPTLAADGGKATLKGDVTTNLFGDLDVFQSADDLMAEGYDIPYVILRDDATLSDSNHYVQTAVYEGLFSREGRIINPTISPTEQNLLIANMTITRPSPDVVGKYEVDIYNNASYAETDLEFQATFEILYLAFVADPSSVEEPDNYFNEIVQVSDTEPENDYAQVWVDPSATEYQVPTWEEFEEVKEKISTILNLLEELQ